VRFAPVNCDDRKIERPERARDADEAHEKAARAAVEIAEGTAEQQQART
jgi:hypothetical protein